MAEVEAMSNTQRRTAKKVVGSKTVPSRRRSSVPKPAPAPEPEELETEEYDGLDEEASEEDEAVNVAEEVPDSIKQLAEDAMEADPGSNNLDEMPVLTIEMIQEAQDRTTEWIPIPEWGGKMQIKSLSADAMFRMMGDDNVAVSESGGVDMDLSLQSMQKQVIQNGVVTPVITEAGFNILMEKSTEPVMRVMNAIMRISKMSKNKNANGIPTAVAEEVDKFRPSGE